MATTSVPLRRPKIMSGFANWRATMTSVLSQFDTWVTDVEITSRGVGTTATWNTANYLTTAAFGPKDPRKTSWHNTYQQVLSKLQSVQKGEEDFDVYKHNQLPSSAECEETNDDDPMTQPCECKITIRPRDQIVVTAHTSTERGGHSATLHITGWRPYVDLVRADMHTVQNVKNCDLHNTLLDDLCNYLRPSKEHPLAFIHRIELVYAPKAFGFIPDPEELHKRRQYPIWRCYINSCESRYINTLISIASELDFERYDHSKVDIVQQLNNDSHAKKIWLRPCHWIRVAKWTEPNVYFTDTQLELNVDINDIVDPPEDASCRQLAIGPITIVSMDMEVSRPVTSDNYTPPTEKDQARLFAFMHTDPVTMLGNDGRPILHNGFARADEPNDLHFCVSVNLYRAGNFDPIVRNKRPLENVPINLQAEGYTIINEESATTNPYYQRFFPHEWTTKTMGARQDPYVYNKPPELSAEDKLRETVQRLLTTKLPPDHMAMLEDAATKMKTELGPQFSACARELLALSKDTSQNTLIEKFKTLEMSLIQAKKCHDVLAIPYDKEVARVPILVQICEREKRKILRVTQQMHKDYFACWQRLYDEGIIPVKPSEQSNHDFSVILLTDDEYAQRIFKPARTNALLQNQVNLRKYCFFYDPLLQKEHGVSHMRLAILPLQKLPTKEENYILVNVYSREIDVMMAWRDFMISAHPDLVYAHNGQGYDNPRMFTRVNYLTNDLQTVQSSSDKEIDAMHASRYFPPSTRTKMHDGRIRYLPECPTPKSPYRYIDRRIFEPCTFKRKLSESDQAGVIERYYMDAHGFSETDTKLEFKALITKRFTWSLESLSKDLLNDHKMDIGIPRMNACYRERYFWPTIAYCDQDCVLPIALVQSAGLTVYNATFGDIAHCSINRICKYGISNAVTTCFLMQLYADGFVMEKHVPVTPKWLKGAKVLDGKPIILPDVTTTLDFSSLYPSEFISNNFCMTTVMRPLDANLEPIDFGNWRNHLECERQLRDWDVRRQEIYGKPFTPVEFDTCQADRDDFEFFYPMSSAVTIRINQNYDHSYAPSREGRCMSPDEQAADPAEFKKKLTEYSDDWAIPIADFIIDRPQFYDGTTCVAIEKATGIMPKIGLAGLALRKYYKTEMAKAEERGDKAGVANCNVQQMAAKVFNNAGYGWMAQKSSDIAYSYPAISTTERGRIHIKDCANGVTTIWCPSQDDYDFMKMHYELIRNNLDKLPYNMRDFGKQLTSRPFPAHKDAGNQTLKPDWPHKRPKTERELDQMAKTISSEWGLHVAYGDTDSIMVSLWMVLWYMQNEEDGTWFMDETTRNRVVDISKSLSTFLCGRFARFHHRQLTIVWEKIYEPYIQFAKQKAYSGYKWENNPIKRKTKPELKSMDKRNMSPFLLDILERGAYYLCNDYCGTRLVHYVERRLYALARTGGLPSAPGLLAMCTQSASVVKAKYTEKSAGSHITANWRLERKYPGGEFARGDRVPYITVHTNNGRHNVKERTMTLREIEFMIMDRQKAGTFTSIDDLKFDSYPLRLDIDGIIDSVKNAMKFFFQTAFASEYSEDRLKIKNSNCFTSPIVTLSDGRVISRTFYDIDELAAKARDIFLLRTALSPNEQLSYKPNPTKSVVEENKQEESKKRKHPNAEASAAPTKRSKTKKSTTNNSILSFFKH